jgi:hypothetical protein
MRSFPIPEPRPSWWGAILFALVMAILTLAAPGVTWLTATLGLVLILAAMI